jgi:hypothetical protein
MAGPVENKLFAKSPDPAEETIWTELFKDELGIILALRTLFISSKGIHRYALNSLTL